MYIKNTKVAKVNPSAPAGIPAEVLAAVPSARVPVARPRSAAEEVAHAMQAKEWAASEAAK